MPNIVEIPRTLAEIWQFFDFLKIAAAAILNFKMFNFLTIGRVQKVELRNYATFRQNRLNRSRYMAIFFYFSKMAPSAILFCVL